MTRLARETTSRLLEPSSATPARPVPPEHQRVLADYTAASASRRHGGAATSAPSDLGAFEIVSTATTASATPSPPAVTERQPLSVDQWLSAFDAAGHIQGQPELRRIIFYGVRASHAHTPKGGSEQLGVTQWLAEGVYGSV